jgi:Ca-activated chloride channel family protein
MNHLGKGLAQTARYIDRTRHARREHQPIVILISDGYRPVGLTDPIELVRYYRTYNIPLYTIGIGSVKDPEHDKNKVGLLYQPVDESYLATLSRVTHGKYHRLANTGSIDRIIRDIKRAALTYSDTRLERKKDHLFAIPLLMAIGLLTLWQLANLLRRD